MSQTLDPILICLDPDLGSPRGRARGPFVGVQTVGMYHNPQPRPGFQPVLRSLTLVVKNSLGAYDVTLAPQWSAAFIEPGANTPSSPGDVNRITAAVLEQPRQHPFYFREAAPSANAKALAYLNNDGRGYHPPHDEDGRWWGLLVRADDIPIGGIVTISPNWAIERDPKYLMGVSK